MTLFEYQKTDAITVFTGITVLTFFGGGEPRFHAWSQKCPKNCYESAPNSFKQSREIVSRSRFFSTRSSLVIYLAEILENPSSFTIMFCACSYEISTVSAISLIFNLRSPIINFHIF